MIHIIQGLSSTNSSDERSDTRSPSLPFLWEAIRPVYFVSESDARSVDMTTKMEQKHFHRLSPSFVRIPRAREVGQGYLSSLWSTLYACMQCLCLILSLSGKERAKEEEKEAEESQKNHEKREKAAATPLLPFLWCNTRLPDLLLLNGPGVCVPVVVACLVWAAICTCLSVWLWIPRQLCSFYRITAENFILFDFFSGLCRTAFSVRPTSSLTALFQCCALLLSLPLLALFGVLSIGKTLLFAPAFQYERPMIIYMESFTCVEAPSLTLRLLLWLRVCDTVTVQWTPLERRLRSQSSASFLFPPRFGTLPPPPAAAASDASRGTAAFSPADQPGCSHWCWEVVCGAAYPAGRRLPRLGGSPLPDESLAIAVHSGGAGKGISHESRSNWLPSRVIRRREEWEASGAHALGWVRRHQVFPLLLNIGSISFAPPRAANVPSCPAAALLSSLWDTAALQALCRTVSNKSKDDRVEEKEVLPYVLVTVGSTSFDALIAFAASFIGCGALLDDGGNELLLLQYGGLKPASMRAMLEAVGEAGQKGRWLTVEEAVEGQWGALTAGERGSPAGERNQLVSQLPPVWRLLWEYHRSSPGEMMIRELGGYSTKKVVAFPYFPRLARLLCGARLVLSHAGAGSVLECLTAYAKRSGVGGQCHPRRPYLWIVPNRQLMSDHQLGLGMQLAGKGFLFLGHLSNSSSHRGSLTSGSSNSEEEEGSGAHHQLAQRLHYFFAVEALASAYRSALPEQGTRKEVLEAASLTLRRALSLLRQESGVEVEEDAMGDPGDPAWLQRPYYGPRFSSLRSALSVPLSGKLMIGI